jgi:hypothetical protein
MLKCQTASRFARGDDDIATDLATVARALTLGRNEPGAERLFLETVKRKSVTRAGRHQARARRGARRLDA